MRHAAQVNAVGKRPMYTARAGQPASVMVRIQAPVISQPGPFAGGRTVSTEQASISIQQEGKGLQGVPAAARLSDVVKALNTLGATPLDLLIILQAMKAAGALKAQLEII